MTKPIAASARYLDIAERRFAESGFHGVSLASLANDAGVSKQALLHYFATKERLYAAVLTRFAERLCDEVDAIEAETPAERLVAYFGGQARLATMLSGDAQLIARALLDSDADADFWPLKPYLDKLVVLARQTPRWEAATSEEALAGLYQLIGALQYFAMSRKTLTAMYGAAAQERIEERFEADISVAIRRFVSLDRTD